MNPQTATIFITNETDGNARIVLYHHNNGGTQQGSWRAAPGQTVGPMTVTFYTGIGASAFLDYWSVILMVEDGTTPGQYVNTGTSRDPYWKECQLQSADANATITLSVDSQRFSVNLLSGGCSDGMKKYSTVSSTHPITHVFVVMLENHSFDNMFAKSGIAGITVATSSDSNTYDGTVYPVTSDAPSSMPTDPGHEFLDVLEQLAGTGASYPSGGPYPPIDNSGFAANYATSTREGPAPPPADIGRIMAAFDTPNQLTSLYQLATNFAICDQWYSSMPGPTWPNRFFVHGASSAGWDDSPSPAHMAAWEATGFTYPHGSIFQALDAKGIQWRIYHDKNTNPAFGMYGLSSYSDDPGSGSPLGSVPQVAALRGVHLSTDVFSLERFASDVAGPYPYAYTFIEPHYGDIGGGTYRGGSSQHPMDDTVGGERLLAAVYGAIRSSPYWSSSLLIVTYDEHGGFYDSVAPPDAVAPDDASPPGNSSHGFDFTKYGVRVPAIVMAPSIAPGTVDHTRYDHTSVLATLERLFGLAPLTARDANANDLLALVSLAAPRTDAPDLFAVGTPTQKAPSAAVTPQQQAQLDARPLPPRHHVWGVLHILLQTEHELDPMTDKELAAARAKIQAFKTHGEARVYAERVLARVEAERAKRPTPPRRT